MALILPYYHRRRLAAAFSLGGLMIIRLTVCALAMMLMGCSSTADTKAEPAEQTLAPPASSTPSPLASATRRSSASGNVCKNAPS
jgi:hypothetical protein